MRVLAALSLLALAACNPQPATYSADVERNFMMACEGQGSSNELCACTWGKIATDIRPGDFAALERMPGPQREEHPLTRQINGFVEACAVTLTPDVDPNAEGVAPAP